MITFYLASRSEPEAVDRLAVSPGPTPAAPLMCRLRTLDKPSQNLRPISSNSRVDIHWP